MKKVCKECGDAFHGRSDAKFCSDQCRSAYNNKENGYQSSFVRKVNAILRRNRKILHHFREAGKHEVSVTDLARKGFEFSFYTATLTTEEGHNYRFCYDQGYLDNGSSKVALVVMDDYESEVFPV